MLKKIKDFTDNHHFLCKILVFTFSILLMMTLSYMWTGSLVYYNGDSKMYISIADNFLDNGHFIQTVRTDRENFVVPLGYPAILTIIRLFTRNDLAIALVQYAVFGLSCVLLYCAERNFFGHIGGLSVLMHCLLLWHIHYAGPGCVVTETWYIAPIIFCVWLLSRKDIDTGSRLTAAYIALFIGFIIRPLLGIFFFPLALYMTVQTIFKKYNPLRLVLLIVTSVLVMGAVAAVNYRETGHVIFTEAYSGISVYLQNNDNIAEWGIDFTKGEYEYADEQFLSIYKRTDIDYCEKNEILGDLGYQYMLEHPWLTVKNIAHKFVYLFITDWYYIIVLVAAGALVSFISKPKFRKAFALLIIAALAVALVTSMGLPQPRYTYIVFPVFTLFTAALVGFCFHNILPFMFGKSKALIPHSSKK